MLKLALTICLSACIATAALAQTNIPVRPAPSDTVPPSVETGLIDVGPLEKAHRKQAKQTEKRQAKAIKTQVKARRQLAKKTTPLQKAEVMPVAGYDVDGFIIQNVKLPLAGSDLTAKKEDKVFVQYTVMEDGRVTEVKVLKGAGSPYDEEAIRVISLLPRYQKPGTKSGQPVPVRIVKPIQFKR